MGPTTETRSRDEWLAEVKRRGGRLRRRRRVGFGVAGALALVLPVSVTATVLSGGAERAVELSVAGPAPARGVEPLPAPPNELATGDVPAAAPTAEVAPPTTVAEVHERLSAVNGVPVPRATPSSVPAPAGEASGSASSPVQTPPPSTTVAPAAAAAPAPCPRSEVKVTATTGRAAYGPGQTVQGSSTLENGSAGTCLLPTRAFFRIVNTAGKDVGSFAYTLELRLPVAAEPGKTFTSTFTWEQKDCAGPVCAQVLPGTYTVVADWSESGPYTASTTFQITG